MQAKQDWYSSRFKWYCSLFVVVVVGLMWLIVRDNYSLNLLNLTSSSLVVNVLVSGREGGEGGGVILSESISKYYPYLKKLIHTLLAVFRLLFFISIVLIGVSPSPTLKNTTTSFLLSPLLSLLTAQAPLLGNTLYLLDFSWTSPLSKNWIS